MMVAKYRPRIGSFKAFVFLRQMQDPCPPFWKIVGIITPNGTRTAQGDSFPDSPERWEMSCEDQRSKNLRRKLPTFVEYRTCVEVVVYRGLLRTQARVHSKFGRESFSRSHWAQWSASASLLAPTVRNKPHTTMSFQWRLFEREMFLKAFQKDNNLG